MNINFTKSSVILTRRRLRFFIGIVFCLLPVWLRWQTVFNIWWNQSDSELYTTAHHTIIRTHAHTPSHTHNITPQTLSITDHVITANIHTTKKESRADAEVRARVARQLYVCHWRFIAKKSTANQRKEHPRIVSLGVNADELLYFFSIHSAPVFHCRCLPAWDVVRRRCSGGRADSVDFVSEEHSEFLSWKFIRLFCESLTQYSIECSPQSLCCVDRTRPVLRVALVIVQLSNMYVWFWNIFRRLWRVIVRHGSQRQTKKWPACSTENSYHRTVNVK